MTAPANYWLLNSDNWIKARLEDAADANHTQVTSGATVTADVTRDGTVIATGVALSYVSTERLYPGDPVVGCWAAKVLAALVNALGVYEAVVSFKTSPGGVEFHRTTITYLCRKEKA